MGDIRDQLIHLMEILAIDLYTNNINYISILKSFIEGFFYNVAGLRKDRFYHIIKNHINVYIHPSSGRYMINSKYVVFHELVTASKKYIHTVSVIEPEWIIVNSNQ